MQRAKFPHPSRGGGEQAQDPCQASPISHLLTRPQISSFSAASGGQRWLLEIQDAARASLLSSGERMQRSAARLAQRRWRPRRGFSRFHSQIPGEARSMDLFGGPPFCCLQRSCDQQGASREFGVPLSDWLHAICSSDCRGESSQEEGVFGEIWSSVHHHAVPYRARLAR
ncbi:hypothetical protein Cni_G04507 [Canna indica]|uniref:Uncharacterized protein n=1 Tax=Canna indica TaxID=4628 RepID=A0AAQ3Q416_9LILI|nr:hypothetical protein Cni_G04507 [Canna indica]